MGCAAQFPEGGHTGLGARRTGRDPPTRRSSFYGDQIRAGLAANNPDQLVLDREFQTQSVDPMFLEPEAGIAWYDPGSKRLELVVGIQSAMEATESVAYLLGNARGSFKPAQIHTHCAYVGGGFGGRDHTIMPLYIALAAMFYPNRPVRLANNRYEQFQSGIKRHAFKIRTQIGVDRATGKIRAFAADHLPGRRRTCQLFRERGPGRRHGGARDLRRPQRRHHAVAVHSRGVTAGSMRGYGTLQTMTALEVLIDEAAAALRLDPIEFRRRNALPTGGKTMFGNALDGITRTPTRFSTSSPRMRSGRDRAAEKARAQQQAGILVGTGVACVTKTSARAPTPRCRTVEITPDGRIAINSTAVEMGTAIGTALANRVAAITRRRGRRSGAGARRCLCAARTRHFRRSLYDHQAAQDAASRNPRWVPEISSPSSASVGAHFSTHGAFEAARVVFRFGLWPAALDLWGIAKTIRAPGNGTTARWQERKLVMPGLPPLRSGSDRREGACARRRDRGDGARLQPLGMVERDFTVGGRDLDRRYRRAGRAYRHRDAKAGSGSVQRTVMCA